MVGYFYIIFLFHSLGGSFVMLPVYIGYAPIFWLVLFYTSLYAYPTEEEGE